MNRQPCLRVSLHPEKLGKGHITFLPIAFSLQESNRKGFQASGNPTHDCRPAWH